MRELLALAQRHDFYVLEDDLLSDLSYGSRSSPTCLKAIDDHDRVIYVRSFSKVLMPGLRLGVLVSPRRLRERFEAAKRATDIATDGLVQRALELYLRRGMHAGRLEFLRGHYGEVYAAAKTAAEASLLPLGASFDPPGGGLHLWLHLPEGVTGSALRAATLARGAALVPEAVYGGAGNLADGPARQASDAHVRLSFASLSAEDARRGVGLVAAALADILDGGSRPGQFRTLL
jgi:DNA-binding transcriptional MocR family regulator